MRRKSIAATRLSRRFKVLLGRIGPYAASASAALILWHAAHDAPPGSFVSPAPLVYPAGSTPLAASPPAGPTVASIPAAAARALAASAAQQASVATIQVIVGRNDTMDRIFRRMALDPADLAAIRNLPGIRQSLDFLKPGDAIKVTHADGEIKTLSRKVSETQTLEVKRAEEGFKARLIEVPVQARIRTATATIDTSLFQAAEAAGISDAMALKLADVFGWDIDFVLDIREGDRFTAVYQQIYQDGKYLHDGELVAAEFVNDGKVYRAIRFVDEAGVAGYYTPDGAPMRKAFLRAPVEFTRVSSGFNPHRLHPILNRIRGHMGTDYAAPVGTPVRAAGEGHVSFAGQRGGYGNALILTHGNEISTLYGHLSRFAKQVHVGTHVQQGEVIGYVGMTGLATGPHLHYEYLVRGVHKDPQSVRLAQAEPLRGETLTAFLAASAPTVALLASPPAQPAAAAPATATATTAAAAGAGSTPGSMASTSRPGTEAALGDSMPRPLAN